MLTKAWRFVAKSSASRLDDYIKFLPGLLEGTFLLGINLNNLTLLGLRLVINLPKLPILLSQNKRPRSFPTNNNQQHINNTVHSSIDNRFQVLTCINMVLLMSGIIDEIWLSMVLDVLDADLIAT